MSASSQSAQGSRLAPAPAGQQKPADQVEYTISQDRAAGHSAQEESNYRLLTSKEFGFATLYEPHSGSGGQNHRLQDYQMQLMLLEQQNKKRLMMARQQQDMTPLDPFSDFNRSPKRRKRERVESEDNVDEDPEERTPQRGSRDDSPDVEPQPCLADLGPGMLAKSSTPSHNLLPGPGLLQSPEEVGCENSQQESHASEQAQGASRDSESDTTTLSRAPTQGAQDFEAPNGALAGPAINKFEPDISGYCILYRVVCSDRHKRCHCRIYLDEPQRVVIKGVYHLGGNAPVPDLVDFLQHHEDTSFVVYRDYQCERGTKAYTPGSTPNRKGAKYSRELISIVSGSLHSIVQQSSKFAPDLEAYQSSSHGPAPKSPALSPGPNEYSRVFLYHHRAEIDAEAAKTPEGSAIRLLNSYITENPDPMYGKCDALFSQGLVSHDTLQWLFHPNDILVSMEGPMDIAYVLRQFPRDGPQLVLNCWNWGYDGNWLHRKDNTLTAEVSTYRVTKINELAVYPLRYATDATVKRLIENGRKFLSLTQPCFVSYEGPDYKGERVYPSDSRCMIDYQVYYKFHSISEAFVFSKRDIAAHDPWPNQLSAKGALSEREMMLFPPGIHGFFLKEKKWTQLIVDHIRPVSWNKAAFDRLVLPKRVKNLIKALVMVRRSKADNSDVQIGFQGKRVDIIAGKGSGLIMLLHGGPGTGKTLTAESVAELAEMPLYSVTCGDIGTSPGAVEKYLNTVLHLGKKWNCVLLLDEADVFLEERSMSDLERNSLVSVFLRTLEYYDGILILTSNRVGTFDEAFKSRIQLALHYAPLDAPSRRKIWHNFLDMLRADNENVDFDDILANMDELSAFEMNGRQIRNALTTARQLSLFEKETLDWDRIKETIQISSDFNRYLKQVHGHTDEQWSRDNNLR